MDFVWTDEKRDGRRIAMLTRDYVIHLPVGYELNGEKTVTVKGGFKTDFASVPKIASKLLKYKPHGDWKRAAVLHDLMYEAQGPLAGYPRIVADRMFLAIMRQDGVDRQKRLGAYFLVRLFGGKNFGRDYQNPKKYRLG